MKRFSIVEHGYDIDEVNRFIDIVIGRLEKLNAENASYAAKVDKLNQKIAGMGNNNEKLEKAILAIQDTSERIREMAKEEANMIVEEAKNNATAIVHEALVKAEKTEHERMILEKNIKVYKGKVRSLLEAELEIIDDLDKEELSEV